MNGRIYSKEIYEEQIRQLKMRMYHCPHCFDNNIVDKIDYIQLFIEYKCNTCGEVFDRNMAITRNEMRSKKIKIILK